MGYPMEAPPKLLFGTFSCYTRCNARTRAGGLCQNLPMGNGRCRMHGGACLKGEAHPRYKHGRYSKYKPLDVDDLIAKYANMPPVDLDFGPVDFGDLLADLDSLTLVLE